jgi:glycosyltransferase involved in cell wall biosynthesis
MEGSGLVYSGIDRRLFDGPGDRRPPEGRHLLYVGRYDPRKGIEAVLRAMPLLEGWTLEIQGTGDVLERERLEALTDELGIRDRVEFALVGRDELPARYRAADVFVFPSEWEEPFGLVPVEAMACGTPVVGTGVGGSGEFLLDGWNCVRFAPGDSDDLARAVRTVADDADLRARLVAAGHRTADYFDVDRLTDAYEAWHTAAAEGFAGGRPASRDFAAEVVGG